MRASRRLPLVTALGLTAVVAVAAVALARDGHGREHRRAVVRAACAPRPGTTRLAVQAGRVPVVLHVPKGLRAGAALVVVLPGFDQTARDIATYTGFSALADREGFAVAYPTASGARPSWHISLSSTATGDDVAYLRRVIGASVAASCAAPDRVGLTGVSNGGGMAARMACEAPDLLAAVAPVAGGYRSLPDCEPSRPLPVLEIHGTADQVVPYGGSGADHAGAVATFIGQWRRLDRCPTASPRRATVAPGVQELRWTGCAGGSEVVHDRVQGAQHGWPGEDALRSGPSLPFASTPRVWRFLSAFRRAG